MKLEQSFSKFLENTVNLNQTRIDVAESGIETMESFLKENELFKDILIDIIPQGSFRQETIIKPVDSENDFDVDLLLEVKEVDGWEPKDYLLKLSAEFKNTDRYKDLVDTGGKERCVTIDYASDFHIDIVPAVKNGDIYKIMNKVTNQFEETDGDGYAEWFASKNEITGKKYLTKVTRLIKYIRDTNSSFDVKSILLTTLLGNQVYLSDEKEIRYPDLSTAFITILTRLDLFLQANSNMPKVENPILQTEDFNRKWNQEKYSEFREEIHKIRDIAVDAFNENDEAKSLEKWQKIFGDDFTGNISKSTALTISINGLELANFDHKQELADINVLSQNSSSFVRIDAGLYFGGATTKEINRRYQGPFASKTEQPRCRWLKFNAITNYTKPYDVYWQVVNTGQSAYKAKGLRGEIFQGFNEHWENSLFTGVHWIECFILDRYNKTCVCRSGPFYIAFREKVNDAFME